ncbi:pyruvate dehydrogenase X component [Hysterangium stoloniferum]|nr:pyruvate dehydrogenase X component [Hysterangium stoloniferum]
MKNENCGVYTNFHALYPSAEISKLQMPAMSPTMTEGGISEWKKKEGESFSAGDVLLEIETDKATIDVEAQGDGIMGKIIAANGSKNIAVGTTIALLAQEGDNISNLEIPAEEPKPSSESSTSAPSPPSQSPTRELPPSPSPSSSSAGSPGDRIHIDTSRPLFPSVMRLLGEHRITDLTQIKGTGIRGMLTKGDVLTFLGKASGPTGTFKDTTPTPSVYKSQAIIAGGASAPKKAPLDPAGIRRAILTTFLAKSLQDRTPAPSPINHTPDSILADYSPSIPVAANATPTISTMPPTPQQDYLDGLH